jgi:hypothetical protein
MYAMESGAARAPRWNGGTVVAPTSKVSRWGQRCKYATRFKRMIALDIFAIKERKRDRKRLVD